MWWISMMNKGKPRHRPHGAGAVGEWMGLNRSAIEVRDRIRVHRIVPAAQVHQIWHDANASASAASRGRSWGLRCGRRSRLAKNVPDHRQHARRKVEIEGRHHQHGQHVLVLFGLQVHLEHV